MDGSNARPLFTDQQPSYMWRLESRWEGLRFPIVGTARDGICGQSAERASLPNEKGSEKAGKEPVPGSGSARRCRALALIWQLVPSQLRSMICGKDPDEEAERTALSDDQRQRLSD